jgi:ribonuclease HI
MAEFDIDSLINDDFEDKTEVSIIDELDTNYLNSFNLIIFTDGSCSGNGKEKSKGGFGMYIYNNNSNSEYYSHNDVKIIKKIDKDVLFYKKDNLDIIYYNLTHTNSSSIMCKNEDCTNYGTYGSGYCKSHKENKMCITNYYFTYSATNIRAEGFGILYALIYIKILMVDNIKNKKLFQKYIKLPVINNINQTIKKMELKKEFGDKFLIVTDSEFWINVITKWMNGWIYKNQILVNKDNKSRANVDIILYINYYMNILIENNIQIVFKHIKGHSDTNTKKEDLNIYQRGNVMADKLANLSHESTSLGVRIIY